MKYNYSNKEYEQAILDIIENADTVEAKHELARYFRMLIEIEKKLNRCDG